MNNECYEFIREEFYDKELLDKYVFRTKEDLLKYLTDNWKNIFDCGSTSSRIILERIEIEDDD